MFERFKNWVIAKMTLSPTPAKADPAPSTEDSTEYVCNDPKPAEAKKPLVKKWKTSVCVEFKKGGSRTWSMTMQDSERPRVFGWKPLYKWFFCTDKPYYDFITTGDNSNSVLIRSEIFLIEMWPWKEVEDDHEN